MHRVADNLAEPADGRLAGAESADRGACAIGLAHFDHRAETFDRAGAQFERRLLADQLAALGVVAVRQQAFRSAL